jgi:hypothetical protein
MRIKRADHNMAALEAALECCRIRPSPRPAAGKDGSLSGHFVGRLCAPMVFGNWFFFSAFSASPGGKKPLPALCFQEVLSFVKNVHIEDIRSPCNLYGAGLNE